ncbi:MAG: Zn-ribbon domain-containing OB-fold protein [Planctomycetes bacterium]|nr:Zn-ribbon domain-containing OB-fold protein [Planctomycetota bacterium]
MGLIQKSSSNQELRHYRGNIPVGNLYTAGIAGDRFFVDLRDKGRLLGTRCPSCERTFVPARHFCEECFTRLEEYVPVPSSGTVHSLTAAHVDLDGKPLDPPHVLAFITFEGCAGGLVHRLGGAPGQSFRIGDRVEMVLKDRKKRTGGINDIEHFRPAKGSRR